MGYQPLLNPHPVSTTDLGAQADAAASSDAGTFSLIALVKRLVVERGISVLFTEHSMDVVFAFADRILVLARGRLIAEGDAKSIRDNPRVQEVYFGTGKTFERARGATS